jgi:hypothetical protein
VHRKNKEIKELEDGRERGGFGTNSGDRFRKRVPEG